jgi:hypothetical protein
MFRRRTLFESLRLSAGTVRALPGYVPSIPTIFEGAETAHDSSVNFFEDEPWNASAAKDEMGNWEYERSYLQSLSEYDTSAFGPEMIAALEKLIEEELLNMGGAEAEWAPYITQVNPKDPLKVIVVHLSC